MRQSAKSLIVLALSAATVAILVWTIVGDRASQPYTVPRSALSGWTIVSSQGDEPWVLAAQPPAAVSASLFKQISEQTRRPLTLDEHTALPLVMRSEYDDALQGVYGVDFLIRTARDAGIETAVFEPVCVAHRVDAGSEQKGELFFVAFTSAAFRELREDLVPPQPEHGGIGVYDPASLIPILPIAATTGMAGRLWPSAFERRTDCQAPLLTN
jgi:hypothetical protein